MKRHCIAAFTLVEVSVVLVIIGLLAGGIMAGQSMVRQAELRSYQRQANTIDTAFHMFEQKYGSIPGEFTDYLRYFPQLTGTYCPSTTYNPGNLNGVIDNAQEAEAAMAQLLAAELVPMGKPQILQDGTVRSYWNCYETSMQQKAAFNTRSADVRAVFPVLTWPIIKNISVLQFTSADATGNGVMTVTETAQIDTKYDDGYPFGGTILANRTSINGSCTTNGASAVYTNLAETYYLPTNADLKACIVNFVMK